MINYSIQEQRAIQKCADLAGWQDVQSALDTDTISIIKGRDGCMYAWYLDELNCFAIKVDTMELVTDSIEYLFC